MEDELSQVVEKKALASQSRRTRVFPDVSFQRGWLPILVFVFGPTNHKRAS